MRRLLALIISILCYFQSIQADTWMQISAGNEYSMAVKSDSTLWGWGFNGNGQLGNGTKDIVPIPTKMSGDVKWKYISCGSFHAVGIKSDGSLWAWGVNNQGQLGDSTTNDALYPIQIGTDDDWEMVSAGTVNTYAIKSNGTLWAWGYNKSYQLGNSETNNIYYPILINEDNDWEYVDCDWLSVIAKKSNGSLWGWGVNTSGQLGMGMKNSAIQVPTKIGSDSDWESFSIGFSSVNGIKNDGSLWGWGNNSYGEVGKPDSSFYTVPIQISDNYDWQFIETGPSYSLAIKSNSTLWGWGNNSVSQLGTSIQAEILVPTQIGNENNWTEIKAAKSFFQNGYLTGSHTIGLKSNRNVICVTGSNYVGQLGDGTNISKNEFECVVGDITNVEYSTHNINSLYIYPNPIANILPFNISFNLENNSNIKIALFNNLGIKVAEIYSGWKEAGEHTVQYTLDLELAAGTYWLRMTINNQETIVKPVVIIK